MRARDPVPFDILKVNAEADTTELPMLRTRPFRGALFLVVALTHVSLEYCLKAMRAMFRDAS